MELLQNIHVGLKELNGSDVTVQTVGPYEYWHYCCDRLDDRGWGCGYRTLQTLCSWIKYQLEKRDNSEDTLHCSSRNRETNVTPVERPSTSANADTSTCNSGSGITIIESGNDHPDNFNIAVIDSGEFNTQRPQSLKEYQQIRGDHTTLMSHVSDGKTHSESNFPVLIGEKHVKYFYRKVPSIPEIQQALVAMGDKPVLFVGSRQWIGSYEVCLCIDYFYGVSCRIIHIDRGSELINHLSTLYDHFTDFGSPVMMGGDTDASSKGIFGVCKDPPALLVVVSAKLPQRPTRALLDTQFQSRNHASKGALSAWRGASRTLRVNPLSPTRPSA